MWLPAYDKIQIASDTKSRTGMSHRFANTRRSRKTKYPEATAIIDRKTTEMTTTLNPRIEGAVANDKTLHGKAKVRINPAYPSGRQLLTVRAHRSWC